MGFVTGKGDTELAFRVAAGALAGASTAQYSRVFHVCSLIPHCFTDTFTSKPRETTMLDCQCALENIVVSASFDEGFSVTVSTPSMTVGGFPSFDADGKSDPGDELLSVMFLLL